MKESLRKLTSFYQLFGTWIKTTLSIIGLFLLMIQWVENTRLKNYIQYLEYNKHQLQEQLDNCTKQNQIINQQLSHIDYQISRYAAYYKRTTDSLSACKDQLKDLQKMANFYKAKLNVIRAEIQKIYTQSYYEKPTAAAERKKKQ